MDSAEESNPFGYIIDSLKQSVEDSNLVRVKGKVLQVIGTIIKASVPGVKIGELCLLKNPWEESELTAEVVGFSNEASILSPIGDLRGVSSATEVIPTGKVHMVPVGDCLLGRVVDGLGRPLDLKTKGPLETKEFYPVYNDPPNAMTRNPIDKPLALGVRALDGLLTCGEGQRFGIFAAAGGGKSTLLAQIIRNTEAEVNVLALVGERGREVREFVEKDLGEEGLKRSVLIISTSDRSSMERLKAAYAATAIAEYFRDKGKKVLLMMDSVTRFARAKREIGLGEPPTRRGFPPSVFEELPKLMERAGQSEKGSITALYTVLVEGDDMTEPVADETRSITDGHIVLSRKLAAMNHYPAIDILASVSRVFNQVTEDRHKKIAAKLRTILSKYQEVELLVRIGEYKRGADKVTDEAIDRIEAVNNFLKQGLSEKDDFKTTIDKMAAAVGL